MSIRDDFLAYPPDKIGLEAIMRLHAVKRWHMIDTTRQQTLAEHSANVALLAGYIGASAPGGYFGAPEIIVAIALLHDLPEVFTGDIPSHTKRHLSGIRELEKAVTPDLWPPMLKPPRPTQLLIKACDLADGVRFIRLHGVDVTAKHAQHQLEAKLADVFNQMREECFPGDVVKAVSSACIFYAYENS